MDDFIKYVVIVGFVVTVLICLILAMSDGDDPPKLPNPSLDL